MSICLALIAPYILFLLTMSHKLFERNPAMKRWLERIQNSTRRNLAEMARVSTRDAIRIFQLYLFGFATAIFLLGLIVGVSVSDSSRPILIGCAFITWYCGLSIGAWVNNRHQITKNFLSDAIVKFKWSALITVLLTAIVLLVGLYIHIHYWLPWRTVLFYTLITFVGGLAICIFSVGLATSFSLAIIFLPAISALSYLWLVINSSRLVLKIGGRGLANIIDIYGLLGSLYFALTALPELQRKLGIPSICTGLE